MREGVTYVTSLLIGLELDQPSTRQHLCQIKSANVNRAATSFREIKQNDTLLVFNKQFYSDNNTTCPLSGKHLQYY